ncbi:hypothetical protein PaeBR_09330 [Paenibacillus sp. BR2-3]|uniref:DUF6809 family protein n=1 Tax=Paenibacillus sp. BR2-3 TaxID=3048494 RepID=UPI003977C81D
MRSLLEQLYLSNLCPDEKVISSDPQYRELSRKTSETIEAWKKQHSEKEFNELETLLDLYAQTHGMELPHPLHMVFALGRHHGRGVNWKR